MIRLEVGRLFLLCFLNMPAHLTGLLLHTAPDTELLPMDDAECQRLEVGVFLRKCAPVIELD